MIPYGLNREILRHMPLHSYVQSLLETFGAIGLLLCPLKTENLYHQSLRNTIHNSMYLNYLTFDVLSFTQQMSTRNSRALSSEE